MSYQRLSVQGFIKKKGEESGMFKKSKYKRYFTLDHYKMRMRIHKTNDPKSEYKLFHYNEI